MRANSKRQVTRGILGAPIEGSSEDDDYLPPTEGSKRAASAPKAAKQRKKQKSRAKARDDDDDLDLPLSVRRKRMLNQADQSASGRGRHHQGRQPTRSSMQRAGGRSSAAQTGRAGGSDTRPSSWGALPLDVLVMVFRMACRKNAIPTADRVAGVCSGWRAAAYSAPDLWQRVDFSSGRYCRHDCPPASAMAAPHWSQVEEVTLEGWNSGSLPILQALAEASPNVTTFSLSGSAAAREADLKAAFSQWPHLKSLTLINVLVRPRIDPVIRLLIDPPSIQSSPPDSPGGGGDVLGGSAGEAEALAGPSQGAGTSSPPAAAAAPAARPASPSAAVEAAASSSRCKVEQLILRGCRDISPALLKALAPPRRMSPLPGYGPLGSLRQLDLTYSGQMGGTFLLHIERLQWASPLLEVLRLTGLGLFQWEAGTPGREFADGSPGFPCLREACLGSKWQIGQQDTHIRSSVDDTLLTRICGKSPLLKELDVTGCKRVSVEALEHLPCKLESLNATKTALATDEGLGAIARLYADTLEDLTVSSAGGWITSKGVAALTACHRLQRLDVCSSAVDEQGLKALLVSAKREGGGSRLLHLDLTGCRSLSLTTRKAANEGVQALINCLEL